MKPKQHVVREISWISTLPQFLVLGSLVVLAMILFWNQYGVLSASLGAGLYLSYSFGSRRVFLRNHRRGIKLAHSGQFEAAIKAHEASYSFFTDNLWIDRFRSLTMMMPSKMSVREMALVNMAHCHFHLGEVGKAKSLYERILGEFPENTVAQMGLQVIEKDKGGS